MLLAVTRPTNPPRDGAADADAIPAVEEAAADSHDAHNKPRLRRRLILSSLSSRHGDVSTVEHPPAPEEDLDAYKSVHTDGLVDFLSSAWEKWLDLGEEGRDVDCSLPVGSEFDGGDDAAVPALVPSHCALHRDAAQRPGASVMGAMGYYCTDQCTPIVASLVEELRWDGAVVRMAVERALAGAAAAEMSGAVDDGGESSGRPAAAVRAAYAITTHPGHHAARDCFGGYCFVNQAARAAKMMQDALGDGSRVAILDVDYHCGNGTASIFYSDPTVWVASIHCDPDVEYPFNSGFRDQIGVGDGWGSTMHVPLPPGTTWEGRYEDALKRAMDAITGFKAQGLIVSLGLDTYAGDQVAIKRAGFMLSGGDYRKMGEKIGSMVPKDIPTVFIQEGGYKMDVVGDAAADVVAGFVLSDPALSG